MGEAKSPLHVLASLFMPCSSTPLSTLFQPILCSKWQTSVEYINWALLPFRFLLNWSRGDASRRKEVRKKTPWYLLLRLLLSWLRFPLHGGHTTPVGQPSCVPQLSVSLDSSGKAPSYWAFRPGHRSDFPLAWALGCFTTSVSHMLALAMPYTLFGCAHLFLNPLF